MIRPASIRFALVAVLVFGAPLAAQIDARMLRHPDVSDEQITFVYAGDIWLVGREGGTALRLSSPAGEAGSGGDRLPDIEVIGDPALTLDGGGPQLERAIEEVLRGLESMPEPPRRPAYEDRS